MSDRADTEGDLLSDRDFAHRIANEQAIEAQKARMQRAREAAEEDDDADTEPPKSRH